MGSVKSIYLSIYLSIYISIHLSLYLSIHSSCKYYGRLHIYLKMSGFVPQKPFLGILKFSHHAGHSFLWAQMTQGFHLGSQKEVEY